MRRLLYSVHLLVAAGCLVGDGGPAGKAVPDTVEQVTRRDKTEELAQLERLASSRPTDGEAVLRLAQGLLRAHRDRGDSAYQSIWNLGDSTPTSQDQVSLAWALVGVLYPRPGDRDKQNAAFKRALALATSPSAIGSTHCMRAFSLLAAGDIGSAESEIRRSLHADPRNPVARVMSRLIMEPEGAVLSTDDYAPLVRYAPLEDARSFVKFVEALIGAALVANGQPERGVRRLRRAVELEPTDAPQQAEITLMLARALGSTNRWDEAAGFLERVAEARSQDAEVQWLLGLARLGADEQKAAADSIIRASRLGRDPRNADEHVILALAYMTGELPAEALQHYVRAKQLGANVAASPVVAAAGLVVGEVGDGRLEPDEAIALLRPATEVFPEIGILHECLGWAYALGGLHTDALEEFLLGEKLGERMPASLKRRVLKKADVRAAEQRASERFARIRGSHSAERGERQGRPNNVRVPEDVQGRNDDERVRRASEMIRRQASEWSVP